MSTATVLTPAPGIQGSGPHLHTLGRPGDVHAEGACGDCGRALAESEERRCADCADLAAHAWCPECGSVLPDADLDAGHCASCEA